MKKSLFGLEENHVAALSYVFTFFTGLPVLILEKENRYVRFHAMQSTLFGLAMLVVRFALGILGVLKGIPILGWIVALIAGLANWLIGVVTLVAIIYMILQALKGVEFKLPILGEIAHGQVNK